MFRNHVHVSLVGLAVGTGVIGSFLLLIAVIFAGGLLVLLVALTFGVFCLGLLLSRWFKPRDTFAGLLGIAYAVMIAYNVVVYRGGTAILMGALLAALAIGYALHRRGA